MAIAETTANFLCRSNNVRNWIQAWFSEPNFRDFYNMITVGFLVIKFEFISFIICRNSDSSILGEKIISLSAIFNLFQWFGLIKIT